ncbi:hypothetical protein POUND7_000863 [Theobroma cacao]
MPFSPQMHHWDLSSLYNPGCPNSEFESFHPFHCLSKHDFHIFTKILQYCCIGF